MKIADISIRQPVFITMIIAALVVLGGLSYSRLGVDLMPDISLPVIAVTVANPGVGPEEMESQVTKPIEDVLSTLNGLDHLTSTSSEGVSIIAAIFVLDKDPQVAATEVREKVAAIRNMLPRVPADMYADLQVFLEGLFDPDLPAYRRIDRSSADVHFVKRGGNVSLVFQVKRDRYEYGVDKLISLISWIHINIQGRHQDYLWKVMGEPED